MDVMQKVTSTSRRSFLKRLSGSAAAVAGGVSLDGCSRTFSQYPPVRRPTERREGDGKVAFVTGTDRRQMIYDTVSPFADQLREETAGKQILIKLNCNRPSEQLIKTHPDAVRAVLDVVSPFADREILVGESTALDVPSKQTFDHFGYYALEKEYRVKIVELNEYPVSYRYILNRDLYPDQVGILNVFLDPDVYVISVTPIKTHNAVVSTLTLKNVVMGAPLKNPSRGVNYKAFMHGRGRPGTPSLMTSPKILNYNLFLIAHEARPDFGVLDGLVGAEGDGPNDCDPVDHQVALAGPDWLAVDRLGVELMGVPWEEVGYLQFCHEAGLGQGDIDKIEVMGSDWKEHVIAYKLHQTAEQQMDWDRPVDWSLIHTQY